MKYEIKMIDGCTATAFYINDKEEVDLTTEERNELLDYLLVKLKEGILENTISLRTVIECFQYDDYSYDSNPCEQCGDTISETFWQI